MRDYLTDLFPILELGTSAKETNSQDFYRRESFCRWIVGVEPRVAPDTEMAGYPAIIFAGYPVSLVLVLLQFYLSPVFNLKQFFLAEYPANETRYPAG